jgi:7-cyano-7-deazaguanine synthase
MKSIIILSGGMDSTTALSWALDQNHDVRCLLSFWYGSKHNDREWESACAVAEFYRLPIFRCRLDFIAELFKSDLLASGDVIPEGHYADPSMKKTVVPFRNGIMISIAAGFAESYEAEAVVLGNHFGDHAIYPDCRNQFIAPMRAAIAEGTYAEIELFSPFADLSKADILTLGIKLGTPYHLTYSCYNGRENHCGKCGTCYERKEAFSLANVLDPTVYES